MKSGCPSMAERMKLNTVASLETLRFFDTSIPAAVSLASTVMSQVEKSSSPVKGRILWDSKMSIGVDKREVTNRL